MPEAYSHEELKEKVRTGWQLPPTPELEAAAREVIRPLVEGMKGQKIIYHCRVSVMARVDELTVNDKGFRAAATILHQYPDPEMERFAPAFTTPFEFHGSWSMLNLCGKAIKMAMITDCFIVDQKIVAEVEAAAARGELVSDIVRRAYTPHGGSE